MKAKNSHNRKFVTRHAIERAEERYGSASRRRCKNICADIRNDRNVLRLGTTGERIRYACFNRNKWCVVVYCPVDDIIVTFLPLDALFHNEKKILQNSPIYRQIGVDSFGIFDETPVHKSYSVGCADEEWGVKLNL
jgi:hypothetical protein